MKVQVTIRDGIFADALVTEAAKRNQSPAQILAAFGRTMLNKYQYHIPLSALLKQSDRMKVQDDGLDRLHVRANGSEEELNNRE